MQASRKTWVIPEEEPRSMVDRPRLRLLRSPDANRDLEAELRERMPIPAVLLLAMTYLPGPLSALLVPGAGRTAKGLALLAGATWGLALWQRSRLEAVFRAGPEAVAVLGGVLLASAILGFAAWSRTVLRSGRELKPRLPRFPRWIHSPPVILLLGACLPGLGLLLAGRLRRAGLALWAALPVMWCAVVLMLSPRLWNLHLARGWDRGMSNGIESVFIASGVAGLLGLLLWTVQALDGMRLEIAWREQGRRPRSDWMAGVLLVALGILLATAKPVSVAQDLDRIGQAAWNDDLLLCPIGLTWVAEHLDPSRPLYTMHLADLYDAAGRPARAEELRVSLESRWRPYAEAAAGRNPRAAPLVGSPATGLPFQRVDAD